MRDLLCGTWTYGVVIRFILEFYGFLQLWKNKRCWLIHSLGESVDSVKVNLWYHNILYYVPLALTKKLKTWFWIKKHCQRHNGPEGWVHITSCTQILIKFHLQNLEQVSTSKSQPNMNISTKVKLQNIDQT